MKTLLIDGKNFAYKTVTTQMKLTHNELITGMHYGFFSSLLSLTKKLEPDNVIVCWDSRESYRREIYPEYKIKRNPIKDENLIFQLKVIREEISKLMGTVSNIGIASYLLHKLEADDIFAFFVDQFSKHETIIATNDEDIYQLLRPNVSIYNHRIKKILTDKWFQNQYGISPQHWGLVKAIGGCSSDCVPGVARVGEETALKYVRGNAKEGENNRIVNAWDSVEFYRTLTELPFKNTKRKINLRYKYTELNIDKFMDVCQNMAFRSFLNKIDEFRILQFKSRKASNEKDRVKKTQIFLCPRGRK